MNTWGPEARIERRHGSPTLVVGNQPVPPMWMTIASLAKEDEGYLRDLGKAGVRVFFLDHYLAWNGPDALERLRFMAELVRETVPDPWLILRTCLYPPDSWMEAHPDELVRRDDGTPADTWFGKGKHIQCLASRQWREDQTRELDGLIEWVAPQPFAGRVIGFFLNAGGTGEWYLPVPMVVDGKTIDHGAAFRIQFTNTLREIYGSDEALQAAWKSPDASLAAPRIPSAADWDALNLELRHFAHYHGEGALMPPTVQAAFCDPDTQRHVADFYRALNQGSADSIIHFARHLKARTGGTKILGAFYGGFGPPSGGVSTAVTRVLDSGAVDFLASPPDYPNRKPGGEAPLHNIQDAYRLRNKIYVVEEDTRTFAMNPCHDWGTNTLMESIEVMKRDFGRNLSEDLCAWWFDMAWHARRWYRFPAMLEMIRRQQEAAEAAYRAPRAPAPEVAFFHDQDSLHYTCHWTLADLGTRMRSWEIHRMGAPAAYHYVDDIGRDDMPDYRLCVFVNAFALDSRRREAVRKYLERGERTALWIYAAGAIRPDAEPRMAAGNIEELTGIRVAMEPGPALPYCRLTPAGAARLADARQDRDYGWFTDRESSGTVESWLQSQGLAQFSLLSPYIYGDDPDSETLLSFIADNRPALVVKQRGGRRHLLAAFKAVHADLLRSAARLAGCHIYTEGASSDDVLFASPHFVTLHASSSGEKTIRLPAPCSPFEIYERTSYGNETQHLVFRMRKGETRTFHLHGKI